MRQPKQLRFRQLTSPRRGPGTLRALFCGLTIGAALVTSGTAANATSYNEAVSGDLSNVAGAPTPLGDLMVGSNSVIGTSIPVGDIIPGGHGALTDQDNDFFSFTVPVGDLLTNVYLASDTSISTGDRFFLGIYPGATSPVDPNAPTPSGLLGYTLPGSAQIGTDLLPALAASDEMGFPPLPQHFVGSLGAGTYTVWVVDGDLPLSYDLNFVVASAPEPGVWLLMLAAVALAGTVLRRRRAQSSVLALS